MIVPAPRARRRPSVPGRVLPLLLVATLLAPVGLLFAQTHRLTGDDRDLAVREPGRGPQPHHRVRGGRRPCSA